ncbi:MAG: hypothetical protein ABEI96_04525 [Haloarculaceae archaeon]
MAHVPLASLAVHSPSHISAGPNWEDIAPVLRLVEEHRDELPDGWL